MYSFGAWAWSSGGVKPSRTTGSPSMRSNVRNRDGTAFADVERLDAERRLQRPGRRASGRMVNGRQARQAATEVLHLGSNRRRGDLGHVVADPFEGPARILVDNEPTGQFCMSVGRDDRLAALALEAAPDPVDLERRAGAASLECREAGLARERRRRRSRRGSRLVERQLVNESRSAWVRARRRRRSPAPGRGRPAP